LEELTGSPITSFKEDQTLGAVLEPLAGEKEEVKPVEESALRSSLSGSILYSSMDEGMFQTTDGWTPQCLRLFPEAVLSHLRDRQITQWDQLLSVNAEQWAEMGTTRLSSLSLELSLSLSLSFL